MVSQVISVYFWQVTHDLGLAAPAQTQNLLKETRSVWVRPLEIKPLLSKQGIISVEIPKSAQPNQINGTRYLFPIMISWINLCAAQHYYESIVFQQVLMVYIKKEHVGLSEFFLTLWGSAGAGLRGGLTLGVSLPWKNSLAGCTHEVKRVGHSIFTKCSIHDYREALHLLWHTWPLNRSGISWPNMSKLTLFDADSGW